MDATHDPCIRCCDEFLTSPDGRRLLHRRWLPPGDTRATVIVFHGFSEHSGRYADLAAHLNQQGLAVDAMDLGGHGRSDGPRALVYSFDEYVADAEMLVDRIRQREPGKPLFVFGHSMGGLIALRLALKRQDDLRGLIVSGASVQLGSRVFPWLRRLAVIAGWLLPRLRLVRMGGGMLSKDPAVVAEFRRDPLVFHDRFPLRTGGEIIRAGRQFQARMESIRLPLLILHGTSDVVTDPAGSRELYARAGSADKTLKLYDDLFHDLVHEPERKQVLDDIAAWIDERLR